MISGFGLGRKSARISGGRRGRCTGERCGDDGSDPWGRPVSGMQWRGRGRARAWEEASNERGPVAGG